jgi:hypothetical protein
MGGEEEEEMYHPIIREVQGRQPLHTGTCTEYSSKEKCTDGQTDTNRNRIEFPHLRHRAQGNSPGRIIERAILSHEKKMGVCGNIIKMQRTRKHWNGSED